MPSINNPEPEAFDLPEWGDFKLAMLSDTAYQRVSSQTSEQRSVSRTEMLFTSENENWPLAALLWGQMIGGCPEDLRPTAEESARWTQIAASTNMPIKFIDTGQLMPL